MNALSPALKLEKEYISETSLSIHRITWRHIRGLENNKSDISDEFDGVSSEHNDNKRAGRITQINYLKNFEYSIAARFHFENDI
jgi:hypothetical protein